MIIDGNANYDDISITIRTDLWHTMSVTDLTIQQDLIIDRLNQLFKMQSHPTARSLYEATVHAKTQLDELLDRRLNNEKLSGPNTLRPNI